MHNLCVELPLTKTGEHKNRVLSEVRAAADGSGLKDGGVIKQVTTEGEHGSSARSVSAEGEKTSGSHQKSSSEVGNLILSAYQFFFCWAVTCGLAILDFRILFVI